jgi:hypothetical protein
MSWLVSDANSLAEIKNLLGAKDLEEGQKPSFTGNVDGGRIFVFESGDTAVLHKQRIRQSLSEGREIYFCEYYTGVMASECAFWKDGEEIWRVEHQSDEGAYHVDARGKLPPSFEEFKRKRFEEQDREGGEDGAGIILELPMDLAREATGFDGENGWPMGESFDWKCKDANPISRFFLNLFRRG